MNQIFNHAPTHELQARDAAHHMHPFTAQGQLAEKGARVITAANGVFVYDSDGEKILDAMAGLWCVNIGYGREELADVAHRQMKQLPYYNTFFQTTHIPAIELSERIANLAPADLNHVFYAGSGSEANDTNIRMVRHYWAMKGKPEKSIIISRKNAYHGSTVGGGSLGGMSAMHEQGGMPIPDIHHINQPNWWSEGGDMTPEDFGHARAAELEEAIKQLGADRVAAFIAEPVQGAGGVIVAPDTYWPEVQRICDHYGILLIADEVICGFGRTGNMWGSQTMDVRPDMLTCAKALSSAYLPISAVMLSEKVYAPIAAQAEQLGIFGHGYTYSAHPVCAAVALRAQQLMQERDIIGHVRRVAPQLKIRIERLARFDFIGHLRAIGLIGAMEFAANSQTGEKFDPSQKIAAQAVAIIQRHGVILRALPGDIIGFCPPLIITAAEIDDMFDRIESGLDEFSELAAKLR